MGSSASTNTNVPTNKVSLMTLEEISNAHENPNVIIGSSNNNSCNACSRRMLMISPVNSCTLSGPNNYSVKHLNSSQQKCSNMCFNDPKCNKATYGSIMTKFDLQIKGDNRWSEFKPSYCSDVIKNSKYESPIVGNSVYEGPCPVPDKPITPGCAQQ
jgi:hypothetical protein